MKELSIEEKAKAYDEAIERANELNYVSDKDSLQRKTVEHIFPQLKESEEDERIRKALRERIIRYDPNNEILIKEEGISQRQFIAWLEKQGKQNYKIVKGKNYFCVKTHNYAGVEWIKGTKYYASDNYTLVNQGCECYCPEYSKEEHNNLFEEVKYDGCVEKQNEQKLAVIIPKFRIGDNIKTVNEEPLTITKIDEKGYWSEDLFICGFDEECIWDLVEQKPTDKTEPKFKQGDWILIDNPCQIESIDKYGNYIVRYCDTKETHLSHLLSRNFCDSHFHLWSIQDAKDGDILSWDNGRYTTIFKELKTNKIIAHCSYNNHSEHFGIQGNYDTMFDSVLKFVPAAKEQRDTLLKAMADAGYTFDFDKKELKKIEQKSAEWSADDLPEFESYLCLMFQKFRTKGVCTNGEIVDFVKEHSQKLKDTLCHVWGEEDEKQARQIERIVRNDGCSKKLQEQIANWFKSLKERVK